MRLQIKKRPVAIPFGIVAIILWTQVLGGILEDDWQKCVAFALVASLLSMAFWRLQFRSPIWIEFRGEELEVGLHSRSYRVGWQEIEDVAFGDYRGSFRSYTVFVRGGRTFTLAEADGAVLIEWLSKHQQRGEAAVAT